MARKSIDIILSAQDRASATVARSGGIISRTLGGIGRAGRGALGALGIGFGAGFGVQLAYGIRRFASESVRAGIDFEMAMSRIKAVTPDAAGRMQELSDLAQEQGFLWGRSSIDAAEGMFELSKAGLSVDAIIGTIPHTLALAAAGELSVAEASSLSVAAMKNLGMEVAEMGRVSDVLVKGANDSLTSVHGLGESFKFVGALGANLGKDLEDVVAPLMVLADVGLSPDMAGTGLRQVFTDLAGGNALVNRFLDSLNLGGGALSGMDLADQIDRIKIAMAGLSQEDRAAQVMQAFGERSGAALLALLNQGGNAIRTAEASLHSASGTTQQVASDMLDNTGGSFKRLGQAWRTLKEDLFLAQSGILKDTIDWLTDFVRFAGMDGFWSVLLQDIAASLLMIKTEILSWLERMMFELSHAMVWTGVQLVSGLAKGWVQGSALFKSVVTDLGDSLVMKWIGAQETVGAISAEEAEAQRAHLLQMNAADQAAQEQDRQEKLEALEQQKKAALDHVRSVRNAELTRMEDQREEEIANLRAGQEEAWRGLFENAERAKRKANEIPPPLGPQEPLGSTRDEVGDAAEQFKKEAGLAQLVESRFLTGLAASRQEQLQSLQRQQVSEQKKTNEKLDKLLGFMAAGHGTGGIPIPIFGT